MKNSTQSAFRLAMEIASVLQAKENSITPDLMSMAGTGSDDNLI